MNKIIFYTTFFLFQLFIFLYITCCYLFASFLINNGVTISAMFLAVILNIYFIKEMIKLAKASEREKIAKIKLEQAEELLTSFRSKHHDFINHLQVIMGLTQLKKYDEVLAYGKELSVELIQIEKLIALKRPELAALITSKLSGLSYVETNISINTALDNLHIQPDLIVSIVGNLLDNALFEIARYDHKWININIEEKGDWYIFEIENPGYIEPRFRTKIFEKGFTTKGNKGTGMGLAIVQYLVAKAKGKIDLQVKEGLQNPSVKFTVFLPRMPKGKINYLAG